MGFPADPNGSLSDGLGLPQRWKRGDHRRQSPLAGRWMLRWPEIGPCRHMRAHASRRHQSLSCIRNVSALPDVALRWRLGFVGRARAHSPLPSARAHVSGPLQSLGSLVPLPLTATGGSATQSDEAIEFVTESCPCVWCKGGAHGRAGPGCQAAMGGRLAAGSALKSAMVSRVMQRARWMAHPLFCSSSRAPRDARLRPHWGRCRRSRCVA
jgi:hypothetical protein